MTNTTHRAKIQILAVHSPNRTFRHRWINIAASVIGCICVAFAASTYGDCRQGCDTTNANTYLGDNALLNLGTDNTAVGSSALSSGGSENVAIGNLSLSNGGSDDTAVGFNAMGAAGGTFANVAVGSNALQFTTADGNVAIGFGAMQESTSGAETD